MPEAASALSAHWVDTHGRKLALALAVVAGFSDAFGFIRLHGLLTSHVTGNLAFMAIGIASGNPHILMKFFAVPIFVAWVGVATLAIGRFASGMLGDLLAGLTLESAFLVFATIGMWLMAPPTAADDPSAIVLGTLMLGAMGTQSALMRAALPKLPSTTAMTTNISEATVRWTSALANPAHSLPPSDRDALRGAARRVAATVGSFACGAVSGGFAALHLATGGLLPPLALLLVLLVIVLSARRAARRGAPQTRT